MEWFKVYGNLKDHPKRWRFEAAAGTEYGLHYLTAFWCYVSRYAEDGDLGNVGEAELARACEWRGDAVVFWDALVSAGFIDVTDQGVHVHDWADIHARFLNENSRTRPARGNATATPRQTRGNAVLEEKRIDSNTPSGEWEAFWKSYPRKVGKAPALKVWMKMKPEEQALAVKALEWQKTSADHLQREERYIPHAATWLNQRRWEDEKPKGVNPTWTLGTKTTPPPNRP